MRQETVEEYLRRGKTITKIPQVLDTVGSWWGFQERYQFESLREDTQQVVSWKSIQPNIRWDTDDDDRKYFIFKKYFYYKLKFWHIICRISQF